MISRLFALYRRSPFWMRQIIGKSTWPLALLMRPFREIRISDYRMTLDFQDNASFKYWTDRDRYEKVEMSAFLEAVAANPDAQVIDVGANYGAFTLAVAALYRRLGLTKSAPKIISIEPAQRPNAALQRSIDRNGFAGAVDLHRAIVGDTEGEATLFENARSSADNRTHSIVSAPIDVSRESKVSCVTLDAELRRAGLPPDAKLIVKMDIQGNEFRAFRGMLTRLQSAGGYLVFFEHCPYLVESAGLKLDELHDFLRSLAAPMMFEITPTGVVPLHGFDDFLRSVTRIHAESLTTKMQGAGSNYIFCKAMSLTKAA